MAPEPRTPGGGRLAVSFGELVAVAQSVEREGSGVNAAPDAACAVPAMPHSLTEAEIPHLVEAVNNSKHVVAGRMQVISEAIATANSAFAATEEQSARRLAALGDFNQPLRR